MIVWIQDQEVPKINLDIFTKDALEIKYDKLLAYYEQREKEYSYKYQDNTFTWDGNIFRIDLWLEKTDDWIILD